MSNKILRKFCSEFYVTTYAGEKKVRRVTPTYKVREEYDFHKLPYEEIEEFSTVDISIPEDELDRLLNILDEIDFGKSRDWKIFKRMEKTYGDSWLLEMLSELDRHRLEKSITINNPAVKEAYDHYRTILKLATPQR